ncbi:hypothetical protein NDA18_002923 [Ustilago nuda]|nr:hypothetical protein NDA18_002923 [Ustilago nuda]
MDDQEDVNYEKYASPTGPRYVKSRVDPYKKSRTEPYVLDQEEDSSIMAELNRSKPIAAPFPKFNPRDVEIFILEAEAWFKFNQVYEQSRMINHMGAQLEGTAWEWWTSKLCIDRAREGRLFNDWHYFTERLSEQFNPRNARMEAYNKLLALRLTSDAPGAATCHVERFRDLEGQVNLDDNELVIDLFHGSLTRSIQEKFERNPLSYAWMRRAKEGRSSYEGSAGIVESGRSQELQKNSARSVIDTVLVQISPRHETQVGLSRYSVTIKLRDSYCLGISLGIMR